ncbi:MAG: hypothetical protein IH592_13000 [Bacteroidales bacterium]|nr:hypothetical protein [Bacteroidales bacterium]
MTVSDKYTSHDFMEHLYGFPSPNVEGVKKALNSLHQAFTGFSMVIEDLVVNDNKVRGRMTARGTQVGH